MPHGGEAEQFGIGGAGIVATEVHRIACGQGYCCCAAAQIIGRCGGRVNACGEIEHRGSCGVGPVIDAVVVLCTHRGSEGWCLCTINERSIQTTQGAQVGTATAEEFNDRVGAGGAIAATSNGDHRSGACGDELVPYIVGHRSRETTACGCWHTFGSAVQRTAGWCAACARDDGDGTIAVVVCRTTAQDTLHGCKYSRVQLGIVRVRVGSVLQRVGTLCIGKRWCQQAQGEQSKSVGVLHTVWLRFSSGLRPDGSGGPNVTTAARAGSRSGTVHNDPLPYPLWINVLRW